VSALTQHFSDIMIKSVMEKVLTSFFFSPFVFAELVGISNQIFSHSHGRD